MIPYPCPPADRWDALLRDDLPVHEQAGLDAHLEGCPDCQRTLEECAAGRDVWAGARKLRQPPPRDAALRTIMDRLKIDPDAPPTAEATMPPDILDPSDRPGSLGRIDNYEVLSEIGRGGMGVVYQALDPALHRIVAIKVLAPQLAVCGAARKRFAREAKAAAAVCHEHVVTIHRVEEFKGLPYLVMHYVAGQSLQDRLAAGGSLPVAEILRIGTQVADGLAAAHAQGIVHRDVKPANILLENGIERVKLTDFSLARAMDDASVTQSGVITGTPQYMAPEQARGEPADARSDLFSLGSVLYALCTGRPPFRGNPIDVLRKVAEETPKPIRTLNPDIPAWLEAIVKKLMAKDPAGRFANATEVAGLLGGCLAHVQQPTAVPLPPIPGVRRPLPRRVKWAVAAAAAVAALVISEGTGYTQVAKTLAVTVLRLKTDDGTLVVEVDDPNIKVTLDDKDLVITGAGPQEVRLKPGRYQLKATKDGRPAKEELVEITQGGRRTVRVTFEADARAAAGWQPGVDANLLHAERDRAKMAEQRARLALEAARAQPPERAYGFEFRDAPWKEVFEWLTRVTERPIHATLKPTGKFTFIPPKGADGNPRQFTATEIFDILNESLTGHGFLLIRGERSYTLAPADERVNPMLVPRVGPDDLPKRGRTELVQVLMPLQKTDAGDVAPQVKKMLGPFGEVTAIGRANQLLLQDTAGNLERVIKVLRDIDSGVGGQRETLSHKCRYVKAEEMAQALNQYFHGPAGPTRAPTPTEVEVTADQRSNTLLVTGPPHRMAEVRHILEKLDAPAPNVKPAGEDSGDVKQFDVPTRSPDAVARALATIRRDAASLRLLWEAAGPAGSPQAVAFTPDGRRVVSGAAGGTLRVWDATTGKEVARLAAAADRPEAAALGRVGAIAVSPDGKSVAAGVGEGATIILDATTGRLIARVSVASGPVHAARFSPDGRILATADDEGGIFLWDGPTGRQLRQVEGHRSIVRALAFAPDGSWLASGGVDGTARVWDVKSGSRLDQRNFDRAITALTVTPDGSRVVAAAADIVHIWVPDEAGEARRIETGQQGIASLTVTADGRHLLTGGLDGAAKLWDLRTGKELAKVSVPNWTRGVLVSPDGRSLLTGSTSEGGRVIGGLRLWVWEWPAPAAPRP